MLWCDKGKFNADSQRKFDCQVVDLVRMCNQSLEIVFRSQHLAPPMILRSITKHVKNQNWFAVWLDLLIVVFGVFIGIQVSNWNEQMAGEKQASVLLNRLQADLKNDQQSLTAELNYQAVVRKYAMRAVDAVNDENTVSDEQFVIGAYQASQIHGTWSNRATYNEMLSTGDVNLIKSESLKGMIFAYYSEDFAQNQFITQVAPYREFIRGFMPIAIQDAIKQACGDVVIEVANTFGSRLPETCELDMSDELISETAAMLRSKPEMLFNLQYQIAVNDTLVFNLKSFLGENLKLEDAINEFQP
jgi:hypothetical protein